MKGGAKLLGHHVHPMLIVFPLGLLSASVVFDWVFYASGTSAFAVVSFWLIVAGILGGLLAAIFGFIDWLAIPSNTRAKNIGAIHGIVNFITLVVFAVSLYFRAGRAADPPFVALLISVGGAALALVGGWLGGELVERLGIGVHEGANPNAPSSLETARVSNIPSPTEPIPSTAKRI